VVNGKFHVWRVNWDLFKEMDSRATKVKRRNIISFIKAGALHGMEMKLVPFIVLVGKE
jgi:hypothetical protein